MTGIERLRRLVSDMRESGQLSLADVLAVIADLIEREYGRSAETVRADAMEAWRWVRKRGGLEVVREQLDLWEDVFGWTVELGGVDTCREAAEWVREHGGLSHVKDIYHDLRAMVERLGVDWSESELHGLMDVLDRRLMPEGMEWPMVDGEPVDFVTGYEPSLGVLEAVSIYSNGACEVMSHDGIIKNVTEIHIAAPKVLDADGAEIRVGDTVYHVKDGSEMTVYGIEGEWLVVSVGGRVRHDVVTHRATVLAADGEPLREGEHVYHVETGAELVVKGLPKPGEYQAVIVFALPTSPASHLTSFDPDQLTHERPEIDSWERLEDDATLPPGDYCDLRGVVRKDTTIASIVEGMARDLVRRARALAGDA